VLAFYGHPDTGEHWEKHCEAHLEVAGFVPVPAWKSCVWHPTLKLFLVIYVDDFKLSSPRAHLEEGWSLIRKNIVTDVPREVGLFLGCQHVHFTRKLPDTGKEVRGVEYNMEDFLKSCVERYRELTGVAVLRKASTPFLEEPTKPDFTDPGGLMDPEPDPDAALKALDTYIVDVKSLQQNEYTRPAAAAAPETSEAWDSAASEPHVPLELAVYAAKILMKILYAARYARMDLLRAVCALAQKVSKWDRVCDVKLYRLVCYIRGSLDLRMTGWVGDAPSDLRLHLLQTLTLPAVRRQAGARVDYTCCCWVRHLAGLWPARVRSRPRCRPRRRRPS
jgi:hypothetical protein